MTSGESWAGFEFGTLKVHAVSVKLDETSQELILRIDDNGSIKNVGSLVNGQAAQLHVVILPDNSVEVALISADEELRALTNVSGLTTSNVSLIQDQNATVTSVPVLNALRAHVTTTLSPYAVTDYTYDNKNQLTTSVTGSATTTYSYTANGHLYQTTVGGVVQQTHAYDALNRLSTVHDGSSNLIQSIGYNAGSWQRSSVTNASGATSFVWDGDNLLSATNGGNTIEYAYHNGSPLWEINEYAVGSGKVVGTYVKNHRGDVTGVYGKFDSNPANALDKGLLRTYHYDPYGTILEARQFSNYIPGQTAGYGPLTLTNLNPGPRYRGYWHEGGSLALYHTQNRHYDPTTGRFLQLDPARSGNNWYAYSGGDPVNRWDPNGLYWRFHNGVKPKMGNNGTISWEWIEDGSPQPDGGPSKKTIEYAMKNMEKGKHLDVFGVHLVGPGLRKNPMLDGLEGRFKAPPNFALKFDGGKYLLATTQGKDGAWDFENAPEAGLEHYVFLQMEWASRKYDIGVDMVGQMFSVGIGDAAMMKGLAQWLYETDAGKAAAQKYGLAGLAVGGIAYLGYKKFKVPEWLKGGAAAKLMKVAREKMGRFIKDMENIGLIGPPRYKYNPRKRFIVAGSASKPKRPFAPNPGGVVRTRDEAMAIARDRLRNSGLHFDNVKIKWLTPDEADFLIKKMPKEKTRPRAQYLRPSDKEITGGPPMTWEKFTDADGDVLLLIDDAILGSDEEIIGTIAHELYELNNLERIFHENNDVLSLEKISELITPGPDGNGNLHDHSWDWVNDFLWPE